MPRSSSRTPPGYSGWRRGWSRRPRSTTCFRTPYVAALKSPAELVRSPRPWLGQVLRNLVRNRSRGLSRWSARKSRLSAESDAPLPSAEDLLTQHEARRLVPELVSQLEEPFRPTVLLCYGQGLAPTEVAHKQGIPAGTVRWRLKRGLDDLRAALDERYGKDRRAWLVALAPLAAGAVPVGAALPVAGAIKLAAGVAFAAALGLWLGTWPALRAAPSARAPESTASEGLTPATGTPHPRPRVGGGPVERGPGAGPETASIGS